MLIVKEERNWTIVMWFYLVIIFHVKSDAFISMLVDVELIVWRFLDYELSR